MEIYPQHSNWAKNSANESLLKTLVSVERTIPEGRVHVQELFISNYEIIIRKIANGM
jgi:hypothetical protein